VCVQKKSKSERGGRKSTQYPTYGLHNLLAPRRHSDVRTAIHGDLFGNLPEFFKDEDELRALWSAPDTRKKLLQRLAEKGFGHEQLGEMQKIINAEKSDLFDVLAYVAYALPPLNREERAARAKIVISTHFNSKQQAFLDFVLAHYVSVGVEELDQEKLTPLLRLKYHNSISDALADLGPAEDIGQVFIDWLPEIPLSASGCCLTNPRQRLVDRAETGNVESFRVQKRPIGTR
jgi:hypothetical protein